MKPWMIPWLFPVGLLATVVSATVFNTGEAWAVLVAGVLLAALVWSIFSRAGEDRDADTHHWRFSDWTRRS
jgi:hypothetical protein